MGAWAKVFGSPQVQPLMLKILIFRLILCGALDLIWEFRRIRCAFWRRPHENDYSSLGSILGSPYLRKLPFPVYHIILILMRYIIITWSIRALGGPLYLYLYTLFSDCSYNSIISRVIAVMELISRL